MFKHIFLFTQLLSMFLQLFQLALKRFFFLSCLLLMGNLSFVSAQVLEEEVCNEARSIPNCTSEGESCANNDITVTVEGNTVYFSFSCLKDSAPHTCSPPGSSCYQFFWDFGDGQFGCGVKATENSSSEELPEGLGAYYISHTYPSGGGSYSPKVIITKRYTNDNPPPNCGESPLSKIWEPIEIGEVTVGNGNDPDLGNLGSACIDVIPIQPAHIDEDVWVVISFMHTVGLIESVDFTFDQDLFDYLDSYLYVPGNEELNPDEPFAQGFSYTIPSELEDGLQHIAIKLHTKSEEEAELEEDYEFSATLSPDGENGLGKPCTTLSDATTDLKIRPKDPNEKSVDIKLTNSQSPETLTYTVFFYNRGTAPATEITIKDTISPMLDLCQFEMDSIKIGGESFESEVHESFNPVIDHEDRILIWTLNFSSLGEITDLTGLNGLWQDNQGYYLNSSDEFNENYTTDTPPLFVAREDPTTYIELRFSIATNCYFEFDSVIENVAEIQFHDLEKFTTDTARTAKVCCDTSLNTTIQAGINIPILSLYSGTLSPIVTSSIQASFDTDSVATFYPATAEFQYPFATDTLDRVEFTVCDTLGNCETVEKFLCIYPILPGGVPGYPPQGQCVNEPCVDCIPPPPPPPPCTFLIWPVKKCWMAYLLYTLFVGVLGGLLLLFRNRRRSG